MLESILRSCGPKKPPKELQGRVWDSLQSPFPMIDKSSDHAQWLKIVKPFLPDTLDRDMFIKVTRKNEEAEQTMM